MGLRAVLKGPTAVQILSWPHQGSNHRPCGSKSSSLTTTLQAAPTQSCDVIGRARKGQLQTTSEFRLVDGAHLSVAGIEGLAAASSVLTLNI